MGAAESVPVAMDPSSHVRGMPHTYSFSVSETLQQDPNVSEEERLIQMTRAEMHSQIPFISVNGGVFRNRSRAALQNVSTQNISSLLNLQHAHRQASDRDPLQKPEARAEEQLTKLMSKSDRLTVPLCVAISLGLIAQLLNGYNTAVLNALSLVVFPGHSTATWAIAVGAFAVGGPVGSGVAGRCADKFGRRYALLICTWSFLFGGLLLVAAPNMIVLTLGRFATGFSSGFSSVLVPIYMGELAPPAFRGFFGTCTQLALVGGILAASLLAFIFATPDHWRAMMAVTPVLCVLQLLAAPFLYESPRWLLERNPHSAQAADALRQLYGLNTDREVKLEISHILHATSKHATKEPSSGSFSGSFSCGANGIARSGGSGDGSGSNKRVSGGGVGGGKRAIDVPQFDWTAVSSGTKMSKAETAKLQHHQTSMVLDNKSGRLRNRGSMTLDPTTGIEMKGNEGTGAMAEAAAAATSRFYGSTVNAAVDATGAADDMPTGLSEGTMPLNDEGNHAMGNIVSESTPKVRSLTKPPRLGQASGQVNTDETGGGTWGRQTSGNSREGKSQKTECENALTLLLADESVRPLVVTAVVLHISQQFCGINAIFYYSTDFFRGVIDNPLMGSTMVAAVNVLATMLATALMDHMGRRSLMIISTSGMIISTVLVVSALLGIVPKYTALAAVMGFVSFFELGLGPIPWLIVAEMFESKYVASAQSLACQINWFCNFLVGIGFPFLQTALGAWSFVPFGLVLFACLVFVVERMPETRNATENDIKLQVKLLWGVLDNALRQDEDIPHSITELEVFQGKLHLARRGSSGDFDSNPNFF